MTTTELLILNLYSINAIIEFSAGITTIIKPRLVFPGLIEHNRGLRPSGIDAARWFGCAIAALGINSFLVHQLANNEPGKRAFGFSMLFYHILVAFFLLLAFFNSSSSKSKLRSLVGSIIHSLMTYFFIQNLFF
eukprot:TRINITY_DN131_c1_g1_i4.p1 TRINITY_DN131_c1_g1~~TRINITY_DN131_c1_g1_i4.p1  ORF type:complete len:134 (+),score=33.52 TRINITY_DN131_c1_g1_i4:102-503(+)